MVGEERRFKEFELCLEKVKHPVTWWLSGTLTVVRLHIFICLFVLNVYDVCADLSQDPAFQYNFLQIECWIFIMCEGIMSYKLNVYYLI